MAPIIITDVSLRKNPAYFLDRFVLDITFEVLDPGLNGELQWDLVYVGCAEDSSFDQVLESVIVEPLAIGRNRFTLEAPPPEVSKIRMQDRLGATVLLLSSMYKTREFIRIGWYVNNEYEGGLPILGDEEFRNHTTPSAAGVRATASHRGPLPNYDYTNFDISKVRRNVLCAKPRVAKFQIQWDIKDE